MLFSESKSSVGKTVKCVFELIDLVAFEIGKKTTVVQRCLFSSLVVVPFALFRPLDVINTSRIINDIYVTMLLEIMKHKKKKKVEF